MAFQQQCIVFSWSIELFANGWCELFVRFFQFFRKLKFIVFWRKEILWFHFQVQKLNSLHDAHFNLFVDLQKTTSDELAYRWVYSNESNRKEKETNLKLKLKQHLLNNGNIWELVPALCHWRALVVKEIKFWTKNATKHRNARIENKSSKADYAFAATAKKPDSRISTERTRSQFQPILRAYISGTSNLFFFIWIAWKMWLHSAYTYVHRVIWLRSDHFKFFSFEKHDFEIAAAQ